MNDEGSDLLLADLPETAYGIQLLTLLRQYERPGMSHSQGPGIRGYEGFL